MCISLTMNYITKIYLLTCNVSHSWIDYLLSMKMLVVTIFESAGVQASADPKGSLLVPERLMLPLPHHPHPGHCPRHNTPRCAPASGHPSGSACNQGFTCKNTFFFNIYLSKQNKNISGSKSDDRVPEVREKGKKTNDLTIILQLINYRK